MKLSYLAIFVAAIAALFLLVGGPGTRLGLWDFRFGFTLMRGAFIAGLVTLAVTLITLAIPATRSGQTFILLTALVIGLFTVYVPWSNVRHARSVPAIHDITTDTHDPPKFVAILPLRAGAPNPPEYDGEETAKLQEQAYPFVVPLGMNASPDEAFEKALATAKKMGWEIVAAVKEAGHIEATDTTFWYGFKDDIVVRIRDVNGLGSVIDVRSKSRVGKSDVGVNAARVRKYLKVLEGK